MNTRVLAISLIVIGTVLLIFGVNAYHSVSSQVSNAVSGTPNTKAILFIVLSIVSLVAGSSMLCRCK